MHIDPSLPPVVAVILAILLISTVLKRFNQPHVIAYLVTGMLLGPHASGLIQDQETLGRVGSYGVVFLMFFIGMEVSPRRLAASWRIALLGTLLQVLVSVGLVWALGAWLDWSLPRIILLGFVISLSSTAVVLKLLQDWGELEHDVGQHVLGVLLIQDLAVIPMMILLGMLGGKPVHLLGLTVQISGALLVTAMAAYIVSAKAISLPFRRWIGRDHETQVFAALTLCFGFALLTGTLGLSTAFGAFVAGMLVARARETHWVHQALEPLRVIFMALFFVSVGIILDLDFVYENWWKISLLVFAILMSNTLLNAVTFRVLGESWRDSLYGGALLSQIGEFSFVLAAAGYHAAIIDDRDHQFAVAIITLSLMVSPVWITAGKRLLLKRAEPSRLPPQ